MESINGIERQLIGAYFRDVTDAGRELKGSLDDTLDDLTPADFSDEIAGVFFAIIRAYQRERGELPTLPEIIDLAKIHPELKARNYHAKIAEWMEAGAVTSATVEADRERIKQESERRTVAYEFSRGLDALKDPAKNPAAVSQSVIHAIEQEQDKRRETVIKPCTNIWFDLLEENERGEPLIRIPTGLESLDKALGGGYRPKTLNIIAARPGEGKSAMMLQQARAAARAGFSPLIFSLEMDAIELIERFYRQTIGGNPQLFTSERAVELHSYFDAEFFEVIDAPMDIDEIEAYSLRYHRKHPKSVFYVDYLGMVRKTKEQAPLAAVDFLDEISRRLKTIAKRTGAPVVLLAQLNRDSTKTDEPPKLSHLRGSGGIEQNADTVSILWNPDEEQNTRRNLKLAKNRQGPGGLIVKLEFHGERTLFIEKTSEPQSAEGATDFSYLNSGGFEN